MSDLIVVVDYGMGNLRSVAKAIEHVAPMGSMVQVTDDPVAVLSADRVVFPGQGAAADCMAALRDRALIEPLTEAARSRPFLGICMGMQVMLTHSAENGGVDLLNWFPGSVTRFPAQVNSNGCALKVPHMGWNTIAQTQTHPLWHGIADESRFYFVHSYFCSPEDESITVGRTSYGLSYTAALAAGSIFAIQAHPEKSADDGLRLLANFTRWQGEFA